jgi:hypothetical protein
MNLLHDNFEWNDFMNLLYMINILSDMICLWRICYMITLIFLRYNCLWICYMMLFWVIWFVYKFVAHDNLAGSDCLWIWNICYMVKWFVYYILILLIWLLYLLHDIFLSIRSWICYMLTLTDIIMIVYELVDTW